MNKIKIFKVILLLLVLLIQSCDDNSSSVTEPANIELSVENLLEQMTIDEKIGQMTQAGRSFLNNESDIKTYHLGSILSGGGSAPSPNSTGGWANMYDRYQNFALSTRLKIPLIYGIDAVHGHNNLYGAVIFPHNIGLGATMDTKLVEEAARVTAREVSATGIDWTFAPCAAVARNERWGRTYESFSENPELVRKLTAAAVRGYQGSSLSHKETIIACAKHYIGDGGTIGGQDQGNTELDEATLREIHMPGYLAAIEEGVGTIMATYNSWNNVKVHGHKYLLTDVLKNELGFDGFIISDWAAINQIPGDYKSDIENSINAGIDMVMVPDNYVLFINTLKELVSEGKVRSERIDDAVRRILRIKYKLGLFEKPKTEKSLISVVGSSEHRSIARDCVKNSVVMLKNENNVLPLKKEGETYYVYGSKAQDLGSQCGGWTISWQGGKGNITLGTTILDGLKEASSTSEINYLGSNTNIGEGTAIVVVGEDPYAEGSGDREDLSLSAADSQLIKKLKNKGMKVICILISGRPMIITEELDFFDAFVAVWFPGTEGAGVADVLFGDFNPNGKLPFSWPRSMQQIPININDSNYDPLFEYGFGLSY